MSYTSITTATRDTALQDRVLAAASKEAWAGGDEFKHSVYGGRVRAYPQEALDTFMWATAIDYEDEYEFALNQDPPNENPGGDVGVITDANIQASVQAHWPLDPAIDPLPTDMVGTTPGVPV